jgi:hypothetical protein
MPCRVWVTRPNPADGFYLFKNKTSFVTTDSNHTAVSPITNLLFDSTDASFAYSSRSVATMNQFDTNETMTSYFENILLTQCNAEPVGIDIIQGYNLDKDNNFGIKQATITVANPAGIYSPERHDQDINWYLEDIVGTVKPLFDINNKITIEESFEDSNGSLYWDAQFTGFIIGVTPSNNAGENSLSVVVEDTLSLAKDKLTERFFQSKLRRSGDNAIYYYDSSQTYDYANSLDPSNAAYWKKLYNYPDSTGTYDHMTYTLDSSSSGWTLADFPYPIVKSDIYYQQASLYGGSSTSSAYGWDSDPNVYITTAIQDINLDVTFNQNAQPVDDETNGGKYSVKTWTDSTYPNMDHLYFQVTHMDSTGTIDYTIYNSGSDTTYATTLTPPHTGGFTSFDLKNLAGVKQGNIETYYYNPGTTDINWMECWFKTKPAEKKPKIMAPSQEDSFSILYNLSSIVFNKADSTRGSTDSVGTYVEMQYMWKDITTNNMDLATIAKTILGGIGFIDTDIHLPTNNVTGIILDTVKFTEEVFNSDFDCLKTIMEQAPPNLKLKSNNDGTITLDYVYQKTRPIICFSSEMMDVDAIYENDRVFYASSVYSGSDLGKIGNEASIDTQTTPITSPSGITIRSVIPNTGESFTGYRVYKRVWDTGLTKWRFYYSEIPYTDTNPPATAFLVSDSQYGVAVAPSFTCNGHGPYAVIEDFYPDELWTIQPYPNEYFVGADYDLYLKTKLDRNLLKNEVYSDVTVFGKYNPKSIPEKIGDETGAFKSGLMWVNSQDGSINPNWTPFSAFNLGNNINSSNFIPLYAWEQNPPTIKKNEAYGAGTVTYNYVPDQSGLCYYYDSFFNKSYKLLVASWPDPITLGRIDLLLGKSIGDYVKNYFKYAGNTFNSNSTISFTPSANGVNNASISIYVTQQAITADVDIEAAGTHWINVVSHYQVTSDNWFTISSDSWKQYLPSDIKGIMITIDEIFPETYSYICQSNAWGTQTTYNIDVYNFNLTGLRVYPDETLKGKARLYDSYDSTNTADPNFYPVNVNPQLISSLGSYHSMGLGGDYWIAGKTYIQPEDVNLTNQRLCNVKAQQILRELSRYGTTTNVDVLNPCYLELNQTVLVNEPTTMGSLEHAMMIDKVTVNREGFSVTGNITLIEF